MTIYALPTMDIPAIALFFTVLVALTAISQPLAVRLRIPASAVQILLGFIAVHIATGGLGLDTGLRAGNFHDLVVFVLLPIVLFQSAYGLMAQDLLKDLSGSLVLAVFGVVLTTVLCAILVYYGIGHASGFPWAAALLTGALLSATDPSAATQVLMRRGASQRLVRILETESLYNDALAIVLFSSALLFAAMPDEQPQLTAIAGALAGSFFIGLITGIAGGYLIRGLLSRTPAGMTRTAGGIAGAYGTYLLAELGFDSSGAMAILATGLILGRADRSRGTDATEFWALGGFLASGALFLLMGATVTLSMFEHRWLAMLIAIGAALLARSLLVGGTFLVLRPFSATPMGARDQYVLIWGGSRGAVTLALALSLPVSLDYWWTVQSMAFGVVLFGLLIQVPTLPLLDRVGR